MLQFIAHGAPFLYDGQPWPYPDHFVGLLRLMFGDLRAVVPPPLSEVTLVVVSFLCGMTVGLERERHEKPAGLRTLVLICVGSAIFTLASVSPAMGQREPARIAAQIVTGVGFLGAGSILRDRAMITGLTTAATVWATAGVGMVVGAGYATAGVALSLTILIALAGLKFIEEHLAGSCRLSTVVIRYQSNNGRTRIRIQQSLDAARGPIKVIDTPGDGGELTLTYCGAHKEHRAVMTHLADISLVESFSPTEGPAKI
jgi:putative Mg2+ transporter-C (MgtC) family protein